MGIRWLVNAGLLALPIGATVGVLLGVDSQRSSSGQQPLFTPDDSGGDGGGGGGGSGGGGGGGGTSTTGKGFTNTQYCQKQVGITPASKGSSYTLNPNQWGWTEGTPGSMCMNVTVFRNNTYATAHTAPAFSVTWQYPPGPESEPVHAYPNVQVADTLPIELSTLQHLDLDIAWTYGAGNEPVAATDEAQLTQDQVNANVAVDMFLDADKAKSENSSLAAYEVMVWFADFGPAAQPIGMEDGVVTTQVLNTTTFKLYSGTNGVQQSVFTWLASETTEVFAGDIAPLISKLSSLPAVKFPASTLFLGHFGMGSEAFSANVNVTFSMPRLSIDIGT